MFRHYPGSLPGGQGHFLTLSRFPSRRPVPFFDAIKQCHFLDLRSPCGPPVWRASVGTVPVFEGSRTLNMLLPGCRNALWRSKVYKTGEKSIFGPFPGGGGRV